MVRDPPPRVFRAGPALTDLFGGQVQVTFVSTVASIEYIRAGRLRALAVTTASKLIADETEKWGKVIRAANIKPE
jgi:tripartite-type tricarboxylate transporter receptor subunit TctC